MLPIIFPAWFIGAILVAFFGRHRRFGFWGYFFASMLMTPVIGALLLLAAIPTKADRLKWQRAARR